MAQVLCVGAIVSDGSGRIVVVRRGHAPARGSWSLPGGRVHPGERLVDAARREAQEETGLRVVVGEIAGTVTLPADGQDVYDVTDFYATTDAPGCLRAGDDAADARWVSRAELWQLSTSPGLVETLDSWDVWAHLVDRP